MKCPTCFSWLSAPSASTRMLVCVGSCDPEVDREASDRLGYEVQSRPRFSVQVAPPGPGGQQPPPAGSCPSCSTPSAQEACEVCAGPIPANWRNARVTCIAMAGSRSTGKSLMLAVAKEQLSLLAERHHASALRGLGDTEAFFHEHYTQPLFEQRKLLKGTASAGDNDSVVRRPLIFSFTERDAQGNSRTRVLALRDVAGEDLEARGAMDHALGFFQRADGVIALIDPRTVRQIRDMLADLVADDSHIGQDGQATLQHVLSLMTGHGAGLRTPIPVAVVLSKVDNLQRLREVRGTKWAPIMNRPGSPLQRDPSLRTAHYDVEDGDLLHAEVVGLLEMLGASMLTTTLSETAETYRYFAASALGASAEGDMVSAGGIAPFRVIDPFKWLLQVTG